MYTRLTYMPRPGAGKGVRIEFRASRGQERRWKLLAIKSGMTLSDWMRHTLDNGHPLKLEIVAK